MKSVYLAIVIAVSVMLSGCATIVQTTSQDVGFSSTPSDALVTVDNKPVGNTPVTTKLARKVNHIVKIELDGYLPYEVTLTKSVSGWVWGNLAFGGIIGLVVDAVSGGMYKLTPAQITAELEKQNVTSTNNNSGLYMAVVLEADPNWQQIGKLQKTD